MPRTYRALSLLALLAVACGDDTAASSAGTNTDASTTAGSTTAGPTTEGPTTDSPTTAGPGTDATTAVGSTTTASTDVTTGDGSDTSPATTGTDTTDATTGTTGTSDPSGTTGGLEMCGVEGESVSAELAQDGKPAPCGPLEFAGTRISDEKGPVWQLDGCECGQNCLIPEPWSFTVLAPPTWLPLVPACPRIVVDRAMGFGGCEFVAVSVWDLAVPDAPAVYHAGHGFSPTQAAAKELTITPHSLGTCACDACCGPSELWDLQFSFAGADLTLSEGESGKLGGHDAIDFESHQIGLCDAPSDVHWAVRRPG